MRTKILFVLILLLSIVFRFWDLGKNPPGVNLDEAAIGWNAYSILKTGRDEYGKFLPLTFRNLDDYKPPLYIYLTVPSVAIFGMNEFAVRFPSALLGVAAVILTFFLTKEIFKNDSIALFASFLLAISPWHLQFTRTAYETGSLAFFTSGGLLCFLNGLKKRRWLLLSALFFGLEMYLYQAAKVFVPLFVITLSAINFRKSLLFFGFLFTLFLLPVIYLSTTKEGQLRAWGTSVFQDVRPKEVNIQYRQQDWLRDDNKSAMLFHPEKFSYFWDIAKGYFLHLSPEFLFGANLGPKVTYVPNVGLLYLWELPLLVFGLFALFSQKDRKISLTLLAWVLLAPIPVSITIGLPSSIRTAVFLPALQIISALGAASLFALLKKDFGKRCWLLVIGYWLLVIGFIVYFLHMMFVHAPIVQSKTWYQGYRQIIEASAKLAPNFDRVLVSNRLDQPLNFYLFFLNYDPQTFLSVDGGRITGGFAENGNHFSNFIFLQNLNYQKERKTPRTLFVGVPDDFPGGTDKAVPLKQFTFLNGEPSAYIIAGDYP